MRTSALRRAAATVGFGVLLVAFAPAEAYAHCDTMDGPVVTAARRALESGAVSAALIWVRQQDETEIRRAFEHARAVRKLGGEARQLADHYFFETLVRVHRAGEGEPYTGLKPAGTDAGPVIPAADRALATGNVEQLEAVLLHAVRDGLRERFDRAVAARRFAPDDVETGRAFVAAYVPLLHYAEQLHALATGEGLAVDAHDRETHGTHPQGSHTPQPVSHAQTPGASGTRPPPHAR